MMQRLLMLAIVGALVAGCSSPNAPAPADQPDPIVVTAPDDYSYLNQSDPWSRPHEHNYWGSQTTKTVMDEDIPAFKLIGVAQPGERTNLPVIHLGDGQVIPQGAAAVTVEITHAPQPDDWFTDMQVSVRTASSENYSDPAPTSNGPVRFPLGPEDADLPHQGLSAWRLSVSIASPGYGPIRMSGSIHVRIIAERGLPIPTFNGHPDQWNGSVEIPLFQVDGFIQGSNLEIPGNGEGCASVFGNCPYAKAPDAGQLVPYDAAIVEVHLRVDVAAPPGLVLTYHGADSWTFVKAEPTQVSGSTRIYELPVEGNGDGPYAQRSLWEFMVIGENRYVEDGTYHLEAKALHALPLGPR